MKSRFRHRGIRKLRDSGSPRDFGIGRRVAAQLIEFRKRPNGDRPPGVFEVAGDHITIPAVIALTAHNQDRSSLRVESN